MINCLLHTVKKKVLKFIDCFITNRFTNNRWSSQLHKGGLPFTLLTGTWLNLYVQTVKALIMVCVIEKTFAINQKDKNVTLMEFTKPVWFPKAFIKNTDLEFSRA